MDIKQAIKILHPDTTRQALAEIRYYAGFASREKELEAVNEACILACEAMEELQRYKALEEQGRMVILPVAEGTTVYALGYILECEYDYECKDANAYKCECDEYCEHEYKVYKVTEAKFQKHMLPMIGKNIFLTKAEAEKALAEMNGVTRSNDGVETEK